MHTNSLKAYHSEIDKLSKRQKQIYGQLRFEGGQTDREIRDALMPGSDMNAIRPRVTELIKCGWAREYGDTTDKVTGKTVRLVVAVTPEERAAGQLDLAI